MSDDHKTRENIATTLADTLVQQGLTPEQTSALIAALEKLEAKPTQRDWVRAARLFRIQKGLPVAEITGAQEWTAPNKLGAAEAALELQSLLAAPLPLLPDAQRDMLRSIAPDMLDSPAMRDLVMDALAEITIMPMPEDEPFHLIGAILHALASMGHRRAMWGLAWHLRGYAAHPDTSPEDADDYIATATMWETVGSWTRRQSPSWDSPDGLLPASDRWQAAESWARQVSGPLKMFARHIRYTAAIAEIAKTVEVEEDELEAIEYEGKTIQLLDAIGGIDDDDGESTVGTKMKPWRVLLEPMPLVGEFDPDKTYLALRQEFPWMDAANRAIGEMVAGMAAGRPRLAPLLIVGDPGIGKTTWALRVAQLCKLPSTLISLSTSASSMLISGDERQWASSGPGLAAKVARETKVANPMIILDELEKAGQPSYINSAHEALLPILDCDTGKPYFDIFLQGNMNLGHFSWLFLANSLMGISAPLLDRLTVVQARRPTGEEVARGLDAMIVNWLPGETIDDAVKAQALAKYNQTKSLRDMRATIERASLKALWQPPGPREV